MADISITTYTNKTYKNGASTIVPGFIEGSPGSPVNPPGSGGTSEFVPYIGALQNVNLGEKGLSTGYVTLDTTPTGTPTTQGTLSWNAARETVDLRMNGTVQPIGQAEYFYVKNSTGSSIAKGRNVRFAGTDGASGHILIAEFLADGTFPSSYYMGVTAEAIGNGEFGQVRAFGELSGINTSSYSAGALLYASTTSAGAFQTTAPVAPNNIVLVAAAINSKNNGDIIVRPQIGSNIKNDEGVKITSLQTGDILQAQSNGLFENKSKAQFLGGTSSQFVKGDGTLDSTTYEPSFSKGTLIQGGGITLSGTLTSRLVGSGNVTVDHADTSSQASVSNSNGTVLQSATLDTYGHVTALTSLNGDSRWARNVDFLSSSSSWTWVDQVEAIDFRSYTTGSSNFPSTQGFAVAFSSSANNSASGFGRMFALNREYDTESYYLGSPNSSGVHNGWRLIYHSGNLTLSTLGGVPTSRTITINGTALDLSANRSWTVGTIGGSIANEQVAYGTGTNTIGGTSTFLYKSNSLLIGTTTSASRLTVVNNTSFQGALGSDDTHQILIGAGSSYAELQGIRQLIAFDKNIVLQRQGGNVLVATTTDNGAKFQVNGGATLVGNLILDSSANRTVGLGTGSGDAYLTFVSDDSAILNVASGKNVNIQRATASFIDFDGSGIRTHIGGIRTTAPVGTTADHWKLGRALTTGTSTPNRWIRVQIGADYYDLLAVYIGTEVS